MIARRRPAWPGARLDDIDGDALADALEAQLDDEARWRKARDDGDLRVFAGRVPGCPCRAYRSVVDLTAPLDEVVRFIADEMFERLGEWNAQFREGHVVRVLGESPSRKAWLMRVFYAAPRILAPREYLYYLARRAQADGRVTIAYLSVDDPSLAPRAGYVRATLHPSAHRCAPIAPGVTRLEHLLATDLGGRVPVWAQNHLFAPFLASAIAADARAQRRLFGRATGSRAGS